MNEDALIDLLNVLQELIDEATEAVVMLGNRDDYGPLYMNEQSIALDVAIEAVGPRGLLTIRQEAWEGLDPVNRQAICDHVRARGVVLLTAEATGGDEIVPEVQP